MGAYWLTDLAEVLRDAGLPVTEQPGWQTRANTSGGFVAVMGVIVHHTASGPSWDGKRDSDYLTFQHDVKPVGNLYLDRSGRWWVQAAGATNTAGKGGPWTTSRGTVPLDGANARTINVEAGNDGIGEPWPAGQQDSYVRGIAALCQGWDLGPLTDVAAHFEWTDRKCDPAGPSRWSGPTGGCSERNWWQMDRFRADVNAMFTTNQGGPDMPLTDDDVARVADAVWARLVADPGGTPSRADALLAYGYGASAAAEAQTRVYVRGLTDPSKAVYQLGDGQLRHVTRDEWRVLQQMGAATVVDVPDDLLSVLPGWGELTIT